jgi:hypothetical protein
MKIELGDFAEAISTRIWGSVGRANWRKFEDARAFVHGLGLKSSDEWGSYCRSRKKPNDIPNAPHYLYANDGWVSWGDWLGTGFVHQGLRQYMPFREARAFVHGLALKSADEWRDYCATGKKPDDIPTNPNRQYAETGWVSWGDWVGATLRRRSGWMPFKQARAFVRGLNLKSEHEWRKYSKSDKRPNDIPATPLSVYAEAGWSGMGDWLGMDRIANRLRQYRSFKEARAFARGLALKSQTEWFKYSKSDQKPTDIPANPQTVYANAGWAGWGDWLDTGTLATKLRQYRSFKEARAFARGLKLNSGREWFDYCKADKKPSDVPAFPSRVYAETGWAGMGDWLGTGRVADRLRQYQTFKKARAFVRSLRLNSRDEWLAYCKSGKKPDDIPTLPHQTYARAGWAGMGDWLGNGRVANQLRQFRSFENARAFARGLQFKSGEEWRDYCKSGKKPGDIPTNPYQTYASDGWAGMGDWLGTGRLPRGQHRSFKKARAYVHSLHLKSFRQWGDYCRSGKKPNDIPADPYSVYAEDGWSSWGDWLGTRRTRRTTRASQMVPGVTEAPTAPEQVGPQPPRT